MADNHYDVIIIGGRCAGASLALRLADNNLKILLVDRATFPSVPSVPSAPFVHPGTMRLLDELGFDEAQYTHTGSKVERFVVRYADFFEAEMSTADIGLDRNYFYGIDRQQFDSMLWDHAAHAPGVRARVGFAVTQIVKDAGGAVSGIIGKVVDGVEESFSADLVVGADGRFSFAARQFGAQVIEEKNDQTSTVYFAEWENVEDHSPAWPNAISSYHTGRGFMILAIPIAERKYHIGTAMRSADANFGTRGFAQAYLDSIKRTPHLWQRLENARQASEVVGIRPIENGYREAAGANWALVGDAVHYKDPSDGQGIYDALLEAKLLAKIIIDWKRGDLSWAQAGPLYQQRLLDETHAVFKQTVANVKQNLYFEPPVFLMKTVMRYMMSDQNFHNHFLRYLSREVDPADFMRQAVSPTMFIKGVARDIHQRFRGN